ncbi:MAG: hypothetical protein R6X20_03425 [Phycisphaerae bacterium]
MRRLPMPPMPAALALLAVCLATAGPAPAKPYARTLTFREPLGYTWTDELVRRDVGISEPKVAADTFLLTGPDGKPVPFQVEVLKGKPDAVRRARLWWKMTLPKDGEVAYRLTWRDDGRAARRPKGRLDVRREGDRLVLATGVAEFALPAPPKAFEKPLPLARAPAPVVGVRPMPGQGPWCGAWCLEGPGRVRRIETTVEAAGPVLARVRLRYVFAGAKRRYEVAVRAVAGEPWLDLAETYRVGEGGSSSLVLKDGLRPAEALWLPWYVGDGRARPAYHVRRDALEAKAAGGEAFATLRPRWAHCPDTAQVCLALGEGRGGDRAAVGAVMVRPSGWQRPYAQFPAVRVTDGGRGMAFDFPLDSGRRAWALLAGPLARFDTKGDLQRLVRRMADIPLDTVLNDWVLAWDRDAAPAAPHVLTTAERLRQMRLDMAAVRDTPTTRLIRRGLEADAAADRALAEFLAGRRRDVPALGVRPATFLDRSYQDAFLAPSAYPRRLPEALALADLSAAGRPAGGRDLALVASIFNDPDYWPGRAGGWGVGEPGDHAAMVRVPAYAAAMMPDHPHARRWMARALDQVRADLRRAAPRDGGAVDPGRLVATLRWTLPVLRAARNADLADPFTWPEVRAAVECLRHLHTPPDPRVGRRLLLPMGREGGWRDDVGRLFGIAAAGVRPSDADLARLWMGLWRGYYGDGGSGDLVADVLLADPSLPAAPGTEADWPSRACEGYGAVLRSRAGTPAETLVALRCGGAGGRSRGDEMALVFYGGGRPVAPGWHAPPDLSVPQEHMHNRVTLGEDENMDAAGRLLAVASTPAADVAVAQVRATHLRRMPPRPDEAEAGSALPRRRLARPARYRRWVMLVKHPEGSPLADYLVVRDELDATEPAAFNLFVLARQVRRAGRAFRFDGQLGADAVLYLATPEPETVTRTEWGWSRGAATARNGGRAAEIPPGFDRAGGRWRGGEVQQGVRVRARPGKPFLAILYAHKKGEKAPAFEPVADGRGVRVRLGPAGETVYLGSDPPKRAGGQAAVHRGDKRTVVVQQVAKPL